MPDPKQLRIMKRLSALLEQVPGYEGIKCYRGTLVVSAKEVQDALSILEAPRPVPGAPAGHEGHRRLESWTLLVQGWPQDDKDNPSDPAYMLKAAVEMHLYRIIALNDKTGLPLYPVDYMLGGDIKSLTIGQGVVRPPDQEAASRLAMFYLPLIMEMTTDVSNPYK